MSEFLFHMTFWEHEDSVPRRGHFWRQVSLSYISAWEIDRVFAKNSESLNFSNFAPTSTRDPFWIRQLFGIISVGLCLCFLLVNPEKTNYFVNHVHLWLALKFPERPVVPPFAIWFAQMIVTFLASLPRKHMWHGSIGLEVLDHFSFPSFPKDSWVYTCCCCRFIDYVVNGLL